MFLFCPYLGLPVLIGLVVSAVFSLISISSGLVRQTLCYVFLLVLNPSERRLKSVYRCSPAFIAPAQELKRDTDIVKMCFCFVLCT